MARLDNDSRYEDDLHRAMVNDDIVLDPAIECQHRSDRADDTARRFEGDYTCPSVMDAWAEHNRRVMRSDRVREAWRIVRPAVWLVIIAAGAVLLAHMVTVALGAIANPAVGAW